MAAQGFNEINWGLSWRGLLASLPYLALAHLFLRTWLRPNAYHERMVKYLAYLMLLEFFVVHSSVALGTIGLSDMETTKKTLSILGLLAFYLLFTGLISLNYRNPWPFISFWGLTLATLYSYLFSPPTVQVAASMKVTWIFMTGAYLLGGAVTSFLPIPRLGITNNVVRRQQFAFSGSWAEEPHRPLAFGVLYFGSLAVFELMSHC